jgi:hypothetical protein
MNGNGHGALLLEDQNIYEKRLITIPVYQKKYKEFCISVNDGQILKFLVEIAERLSLFQRLFLSEKTNPGGYHMNFGKGLILWLIGIPLPIIILLAIFWN